jgi:DNA-binding beta-propeller fold protein YncE
VATAGGVYRVDAKARVLAGQLTSSPARHVALSENGAKVFVLEHDVIVAPDGTRDIKPFRLKTLDAATGKVVDHEEIGQRILFALPSEGGRYHLILTEAGEVIVGVAGTPLAEGRKLELVAEPLRVRPYVAVYGGHAYVPVEGEPARVFDVDLATGDSVAIGLGRNIPLRGMAVTPDGSTLIINAIREVILVDRTGRAIKQRMELPAPHQGVALSPDGEFAFLAQTIDGTGGAVGIVELAPLSFRGKVHLDDISPWTIAVAP